jgi:hypothetical protein
MISYYINDHDILHKLLFALNRYVIKVKAFKVDEINKNFVTKIANLIYSHGSSVIVNREGIRLLCSLSMLTDNSVLWSRFDYKKEHINCSNHSDIITKYKIPEIEFEDVLNRGYFKNIYTEEETIVRNKERGKILYTPHKTVNSFNRMGIIMYSAHVLIIPKLIHLEKSFTISFRFYNPIINTNKFHTLIQNPAGVPVVCFQPNRKFLGCYSLDGQWLQADFNFLDDSPNLRNKWIHVAITYREEFDSLDNSLLNFYVDGKIINSVSQKSFKLPKLVKYIGNSKNMDEPFGIFCDLRIYNKFFDEILVKELCEEIFKNQILKYFDEEIVKTIVNNFLNSDDNSEETFYYTIKLLNNILVDKKYRTNNSSFSISKSHIIMKICENFHTNLIETKKEISKFLKTLE